MHADGPADSRDSWFLSVPHQKYHYIIYYDPHGRCGPIRRRIIAWHYWWYSGVCSPELIFHETAGICSPVSDFQIASSGISSGFPDVSMFPRRHLHLQPADFHWLLTFVRLSDSFYSIFCIICGIYADIIYKMHIFKHAEDFFRNNQKKQLQIICVYSIILIKIMNRKTQWDAHSSGVTTSFVILLLFLFCPRGGPLCLGWDKT